MYGLGTTLIVLGMLLVMSAATKAGEAPNLPHLMGMYLPGIVLLAIGLKLRQQNSPATQGAEDPLVGLQVRRRADAELGILGGVVLMFIGGGLARLPGEIFFVGAAVLLGGWVLMIWGTANYMKWKGYSQWFGLFGLLLLPGLLILVCFPNKMKDGRSPLPEERGKTRWVVLTAIVVVAPLIALPVMFPQRPRAPMQIVWATVASDPPKFTIEMPGNPQRQVFPQEGADGEPDATTYAYESRDDIATYTATVISFAVDPSLGPQQVAEEELEPMLDRMTSHLKGRVLYRKTISLGEHLGREQMIEFNPDIRNRAGEPIIGLMVWKLYFVRDSIIALSVSLPKSDKDRPGTDERLARFFNSLKVE